MRFLKVVLAVLISACALRATPCVVNTMAVYDAARFTCYIGDKLFSDFTYASSGSNPMPASSITVSPMILLGNEIGFQFDAPWIAGAGQSTDSLIGYTISGPQIDDAELFMGGFGATGTGFVAVAENLFVGSTDVGNLYVYADAHASLPSDAVTFAPVTSVRVAYKDVVLSGGVDGSAEISTVSNLFSQLQETPEPGTLSLLGIGLLVLGKRLTREESK